MPSRSDPALQAGVARQVIGSDPLAVREGLLAVAARPPLSELSQDQRGIAELVLAEVLNNIVEHAYARTSGDIEVRLLATAGGITCKVIDAGVAMPDHAPPSGSLPAGIGGPPDDLPEGGFGWHLIRTLTRDLAYERQNGRNHLSFVIPLDAATPQSQST
jgi:serine/threonine-protein kinase RsbW